MGGLLAYIKDNINKHFTLQNGYEILSKTFSKVEKKYIDSLAVPNLDDMVDYIYSLSSMTSLRDSVPEQVIKDILMKNTIDGVLNVPKEYGMFISL